MRKFILVLLLFVTSTVTMNAQGGYRGFFDVTASVSEFNLDITTAHGYQFNKNWFLGAGTGVINVLQPCKKYKEKTTYGTYWGEEQETIGLPLFAKVRFDMLGEKSLTYFAEADLGYAIVLRYVDEFTPLYASVTVGLRQRLTSRLGLNFGIGCSVVPTGGYADHKSYYGDSKLKFNIKVGVDF